MASSFQKEREDRELFSELIEPPVNPFLFHVQPPLINGLDLNFYVQICWETLWVRRGLTCDKVRLFDSFKDSLKMLGYDVKDECKTRVVPVLITRIHWMLRQTAKIKNAKRRRMTREEKWCTITITEGEICESPGDIVAQRKQQEKELEEENERLRSQLNDKVAHLYEEMARAKLAESTNLSNHGKQFHEVGARQQKRQLDKVT